MTSIPSVVFLAVAGVRVGGAAAAWISAPQRSETHRGQLILSPLINNDNPSMESTLRTDDVLSAAASPIDLLDRHEAIVKLAIAIGFSTTSVIHQPDVALAYTPDSDKLRESLYLMSRVQESTVQLDRLVRNSQTQEEVKPKLKLKLKLVQASYRLLDQINYASQFVDPPDELVTASEAGNIAVESLQDAVVFARDELGTGPITNEQREFFNEAMQTTRDSLFTFLKYMPQDKLEQARKRVEVENVDNRDEFDDDIDKNAGVYNPVKLPWKQ